MVDTPPVHSRLTVSEESALRLDGLSWSSGSLVWPHPAPPLLPERAEMVRDIVPGWAIVTAHTAAWIYTGMGRAEPWALCVPSKPAISPLQRRQWRPRSISLKPQDVVDLRGLKLTSVPRTVYDLLTWPGSDEVAACQLYLLATPPHLERALAPGQFSPLTWSTCERARRRTLLVQQWWRDYPLVTR